MGIRFRCPNCNRKLNIKTAQSGQQGICPKCRETLKVPAHSELDSAGEDLSQDELKRLSDEVAKSRKDSDVSQPSNGNFAAPPFNEIGEGDFLCGRPGTVVHENYIDPIYEAPHRVWHIRDGNQIESGPFRGKKLRKKIDAGQLKANDFVCREDWQDWRLASEAFPELGKSNSQIPLASDSVFTDANYEISGTLTAKARQAKAKQRNTTIQITLCVAGLLIMAALCYLLIRLI